MKLALLLDMIPIAFMFAAPIVMAALGGLFSERSGIVNIALEGIMMVGAFSAAALTVVLEPITPLAPWLGLLLAVLAGILFSAQHAPGAPLSEYQGSQRDKAHAVYGADGVLDILRQHHGSAGQPRQRSGHEHAYVPHGVYVDAHGRGRLGMFAAGTEAQTQRSLVHDKPR